MGTIVIKEGEKKIAIEKPEVYVRKGEKIKLYTRDACFVIEFSSVMTAQNYEKAILYSDLDFEPLVIDVNRVDVNRFNIVTKKHCEAVGVDFYEY